MSNLNLVDLKKKAEDASVVDVRDVGKEKEAAKEVAQMIKKEYVDRELKFEISYETEKGLKKATLCSAILDSEGRLRQDKILMRLCDGYAYDDYPVDTKTRYQCVARIVSQLKDPPEWVLEVVGSDLEFCYHLATRLVEHETRYFRNSSDEGSGEKKPQRFSIDFPALS